MSPEAAAWIRDNVLNALPCSIATGANHLDTACDRHPTGKCTSCAAADYETARFGRNQPHHCRHGRSDHEGRLRVAGRFSGPRGCRLPEVPTPDRIWLADRTCRTYCACPCRHEPVPALFDTDLLAGAAS